MAEACKHPYTDLVVLSTADSRGRSNAAVRVSCSRCGKVLPGVDGLILLAVGIRDQVVALSRTVTAMGGEVKTPVMSQERGPARGPGGTLCKHYLSWLTVDNTRGAQRGRAASQSVTCKSCGRSWPDQSQFLAAMRDEIEKLWLAVQKLGGERQWEA